MKMADFRANEELVTWAHKVMTHKNWRLLMETMMMEEHPMRQNPGDVLPAQSDSKKLGVVEGFNEFHDKLNTAKLQLKPTTPIESKYEKEEST